MTSCVQFLMFYVFNCWCADSRQIIEKSINAARNFTQSDSDNFSCPSVDHEQEKTICLCAPYSHQGTNIIACSVSFQHRILILNWLLFSNPVLLNKYFQVCNHASRYAIQQIWCLPQARINWEGCDRKGIQRKIGGWWRWGIDGPDGMESSRIVGALACLFSPTPHKIQNDDRLAQHISGVSGWMSLLVPANPGSPWQKATKRQCVFFVYVCMYKIPIRFTCQHFVWICGHVFDYCNHISLFCLFLDFVCSLFFAVFFIFFQCTKQVKLSVFFTILEICFSRRSLCFALAMFLPKIVVFLWPKIM